MITLRALVEHQQAKAEKAEHKVSELQANLAAAMKASDHRHTRLEEAELALKNDVDVAAREEKEREAM